MDQSLPKIVNKKVQKCVGIANTSTQNSEITVSSVSDGSFMAPSVENICDDSQENNKQPFCNVQMNVYELESSKEEQNEITTKPSIENFVQEMNIDYISPEADKFMIEDESLSMYLNNSDEFQDKSLLENDTALMPIGSCERNQHTTTSNKSSAKGTVSTIVKENCESMTLQNTINCDMLSTERRETNILTPDSFDKIPDVTLSTEVGKTHITTKTEESEEPAGTNTQSKDDERHSSCSESKSTAITSIASDKQDITSCSSTNVTDEAIDNSRPSTSSVMDGSVKKDIKTLCEKQFQEENERSLAANTTDTILNMEDTPCTLCMEEQNSSVSVIRSSGKYSDVETEHYDRTKENNSNNNSFDVRSEDLAISNSIKEDPSTESTCDVSLAHSKNTVEPQQYEGVCSIYPHDNKGECIVPQIDVTISKVKDEQSEKIIQGHKALNVPCENDSLAHIRETRVNLNDMGTKHGVPSEYLPIPDPAISNQETKTTVLVTSLIKECKGETEGFKSSCPHPEVANDVKSGSSANIPMCREHLSTDSNERKLKDGPDEESIETHEVHLEESSSTCVRETTVNLDDIEMKNALPSECSLKLVPPLSDQASKAAVPADTLIKECKSETEDVKCSGPHNVAVVANDVKQEKPTNIPMPLLHLSRECTEVTNVSVKCEDCTENPSNPAAEKEGCEDQNLENLKAGVVVMEANEHTQPQQTDFSQKLVCSVTSSDDVEDRLIVVHPDTSSPQLIPDTATLESSEDVFHTDNNKKVSGDGNPAGAEVVSVCGSSMSTDSSWCNSNSLETRNSEDTSPGSSVNAVSVSSECGASGNQQLDDDSVVCMDETGANSKEECRTARRASSSSIPPVKEFLNDNSEQPKENTVKSENCDDCIDFNKSLSHLCDSVADKVATVVDEVSADTSLILGHTDSEADVLNCKNVSSVNNEESASRKLKSDDLCRNGYLCDKEEISVIDNHPSSESEENSKEHDNVQNLSLPRDYKDIMATSDDECKEKISFDGNSQIPVKVFSVQDSANVTTEQEVNSCLVPAESMIIDLKLNAESDVTVCNANVVDSAPDAVKTESSPISAKENIEIVSSTGTSNGATLSENTADIPTLSSEIEEPGPTLLPANEKSSSKAVCDVSNNASSPLTASKICRKRKNSDCTNMDNSNSKIQILEFDGDKLVKASVETVQYNSGSDESHREETSTDNFCISPERKLQLSCNVSNSNVMSSVSRCENIEETTGRLKTSATDNDGDTPHCHEYSEFRKARDVSESKICSRNGEELENNDVGVSGVTTSNNNRLSHNDCKDTVDAEGIMRMDGTESSGALQGTVNGQKRKNSQQESRIPENGAEMPLEKKKHISSPVQITEYPERPEDILESVALCPTKLKAELSTPKCAYNTRHKGTLHTVLKLDQASGFCSPVIGKGRGRGRGRGIVKEETTEQCVGSPPGDRGRGRGRGRARGRGRGRGRGGAAQEPVGDPTPPEEATALPGPLVTENEVSNTTSSDAASSGTVPAVKRKRGRSSLKPQPVERTEVHGEKKEDGPSSSSSVPHDVNTNIKSSSSVANAGVDESEENDKVTTREGEEKNECKNIHSDLENKPFLKENEGGFITGRGKRTKRRNYKIMVSNDSMFSSEDEQSTEGNTNHDTFEDVEHSPQCTKRGRREERSASISKTPSRQNGKSLEDNIINESSDLERSNTATTGEGDQNNACKNTKSEIQGKSFLKENEESVVTSQRKDSVKQEEARNDKVIVSNDSMFSSEDGQSKEGNTVDDTFERDEYSPQRRKGGERRASTNKILSKQNGKNQSNTAIKREGDQNNECKNIIPKFEEESFLKEDDDKATTTLRRSSGRRGRLINYKMTESNESMFSNDDEESDEGNAVDDTFEDEEYLPEPKIRRMREGRRTSNRVSSIPGGGNCEDSTTNENSEEGLFPGQHGRRGTRQGRRGKSNTCKTEPRNDSDKDEQSGDDNFSDESCEDKEYSPYKRRKAQVRKKTGTFGKRRARGRGKATTSSAGGQGLAIKGEDSKEIQVKCGKCAEEMTNWSFDAHNYQKHNGLGWIEGQEPIDTADEKVVQRILFKMRKKGKKSFVCEICDDVKKSVVGFMSHLQFCQKTTEEREAMKERCPFCERCLIPSSMKVHLQLHRSEHERQQQEEELISSSNQARRHKRAAAEKAATLMQEFIKGVEDDEPSEEQKADKDELFKQLGYTRPSNSLRGRWRMAITRNGKIKCNNPGCVFDTSEVVEMEQHYADCPRAPRKGYVCKLCDHHCNQESEIREHLKEHENTNPAEETDSSGVEEDFDGEVFHERTGVLTSLRVGKPKNKRYKLANKMTFLARESSGSVIGDRVFAAALRWTAKFHVQHYKDSLFPLYHTSLEDWTTVEESLIEEYLPAARESMMISQVTMKGKVADLTQQNMEWRKYNLFEAAVKDDAVTVFVGGPVWAMAWCPLPFRLQIQEDPLNRKQYLAITCHRSMEDQYSTSRSYSGPGLIQMWCFEDLDSLKSPPIPFLDFAIAHNYGAVWCMEWCPSGCYERKGCDAEEEHLRRLGLLAAACSDGCVHIFSVCHPDEVLRRECERYPVFKAEPVVSLMLEEDEETKLGGIDWQCLRLTWCKVNGHRIIAASFSNGMVALWDIETSSRLLYRICGKRKLIYPYHTFQPHGGPVTALAMSPLNERFLMTGSYDRTCKFWDTHDTAEPITSTFKGLVTDGIWLTHWPSAVSAYDDVYSRCHTNSTLTPVRNFGYSPYPLLAQNSVAWGISSSDWVNSVAQGTSAGELSAIFLHQLLIGVDTEKGMKNKRMILSYTELVNFKESVSTSELTESAGKVEEDTVEQETSAAESMTIDAPGLASPDAQASFGADSGKSPKNENVANGTHSDSACGSSTDGRVDELVLGESRGDDRSVNDPLSTVKQQEELDESQQTNDISMNESCSDVKEVQKTDQFPEDVKCTSFSSVRDCETDPLACDDSQSVLNSPSCSQASEASKKGVRSKQGDSEKTAEATQEKLVLNPRTYSEVEKSFGVVLCDFPTDDFSKMPQEARLWMRQSDQMRMFPTEMYPVLSINRVAWNPNIRSFLWVASGYQNGLVRLKCVSAMYTQDVAKNMLRLRDAYS